MEVMKKEFKIFKYMTPITENAMVLGVTMKCLVQQHRDFFNISQFNNLRPEKRILAYMLHYISKIRQRLDIIFF
jgi:hypothetical protein